jgi:fructose-bisphosphate aldolase, class II
MSLISLRQLLDHAAEHSYGVPAFNVNNLEQVQAIMEAAQETRSPVILQASAGARKYAGESYLRHMVLAAVESHPGIPVVLHQDHGASPAVCTQSIRSGFTSVMMDGVGAEGALTHEMMLTDPAQAKDFVARTDVDALAIAIGTSHGAYKFTRQPTGDILDIDRIEQIHAAVPNTHLVMHGSSSVPQEWLTIIREHGGNIKETYGVPVEEIRRGIRSGVRKVNIDTDIRLTMTGAMRQAFSKDPGEFDPRMALMAAKKAARELCKARFEAFGCGGHADRIVPISLELMAKRYH